jgi:CcmD family protein
MRDNLGYLFAAYFVLWIISFILVASIAVRQKRLEREIDRLREGDRGQGEGETRRQEDRETTRPRD